MTQENKICPTHHLELLFKPEGISKKGNRYNAFWACPNRDCKHTENIEEKQGHFLSMQAEFRRAKEIAFFNSVNAAVEMVNGKPPKAEWNAEFYQGEICFWRDWFFAEWQAFYKKQIMEIEE